MEILTTPRKSTLLKVPNAPIKKPEDKEKDLIENNSKPSLNSLNEIVCKLFKK